MWQRTILITISLVIGLFSAPLCLDRFQVSDQTALQILLSSAGSERINGYELGGNHDA